MMIYARATTGQKIWYWTRSAIRMGAWIAVVMYIDSHAPAVTQYVEKPIGTTELPIGLLIENATIQMKESLKEMMITLGWGWNLYLLFCEAIPLLPRKLLMQDVKEQIKRSLIGCTIVICAYMGYMLSL